MWGSEDVEEWRVEDKRRVAELKVAGKAVTLVKGSKNKITRMYTKKTMFLHTHTGAGQSATLGSSHKDLCPVGRSILHDPGTCTEVYGKLC